MGKQIITAVIVPALFVVGAGLYSSHCLDSLFSSENASTHEADDAAGRVPASIAERKPGAIPSLISTRPGWENVGKLHFDIVTAFKQYKKLREANPAIAAAIEDRMPVSLKMLTLPAGTELLLSLVSDCTVLRGAPDDEPGKLSIDFPGHSIDGPTSVTAQLIHPAHATSLIHELSTDDCVQSAELELKTDTTNSLEFPGEEDVNPQGHS